MGDARDGLRGAGEVGAAPGYFPFFLHDGVAAGGAQPFRGFQDAVGPGVLRAFGKVHFQNGRDDFPRLFHQHRIAYANVLPVDFILVVEGGPRYRRTGQQHRLQFRHRCQHPGASYLHDNIQQGGFLLFRGEFIRRRPAGRASRSSQRFPRSRVADFNNGSVRAVGERMAEPVNIPHGLAGGFQAVRVIHRLIAGDAATAEHVPEVFCVPEFRAFIRAQSVGQEGQRPGGHLPGVQLLEGSGGGVARVGECGEPVGVPFFVQFGKGFIGHEDFPAHFQHGRRAGGEGEGDAADGADVGRYVVPHVSVSARGRISQLPVAVHDGKGHSVNLGLHGDGHVLRLQRPGQLMVEFRQFFIRYGGVPLLKNVVNRQHGHRMSDLVEALERGAAYAARGGVRIRQFGMGFFQFFQLQEQGVIFRVGNLRFRLFVIQTVVAAQFGTQIVYAAVSGVLRVSGLVGAGIFPRLPGPGCRFICSLL